jgi:hypothetical protein
VQLFFSVSILKAVSVDTSTFLPKHQFFGFHTLAWYTSQLPTLTEMHLLHELHDPTEVQVHPG